MTRKGKAFLISAILSFSGGFQDAYTYFLRGNVFANAQTGNIVLMSRHLFDREWGRVLHYLFPVLAFILGIFLTAWVSFLFGSSRRLRWQQIVLATEIAVLSAVAFIPHELDSVATVLVSFSCAMQVQAFRQAGGLTYASTMIIGNLRSGTEELSLFLHEHKKERLHYALFYFGVILVFALGAGTGGVLSTVLGLRSILISAAALLLVFGIIFIKSKPDKASVGNEAVQSPETSHSGEVNNVTPSP